MLEYVVVFISKLFEKYRDSIKALKDGEDAKRKTYTALCVISKEAATETVVDKLIKLEEMGEVKLSQRTPIRVLHRRYVYHYFIISIRHVNLI